MQEDLPVSMFDSETLYQIPEHDSDFSVDLSDKVMVVFLPVNSLNEEAKLQIEKIFLSCKIEAASIFITDKLLSWSRIQQMEKIENIVLFGVNPKDLGISYHIFPNRFFTISGKNLLLADELNNILTNANLKSDFWFKCLKPHFNIA